VSDDDRDEDGDVEYRDDGNAVMMMMSVVIVMMVDYHHLFACLVPTKSDFETPSKATNASPSDRYSLLCYAMLCYTRMDLY